MHQHWTLINAKIIMAKSITWNNKILLKCPSKMWQISSRIVNIQETFYNTLICLYLTEKYDQIKICKYIKTLLHSLYTAIQQAHCVTFNAEMYLNKIQERFKILLKQEINSVGKIIERLIKTAGIK